MSSMISRLSKTFSAAALTLGVASCGVDLEYVDLDEWDDSKDYYDKIEQLVVDEWISQRADSLLDNRQPGGYYVYVVEEGNGTTATNDMEDDFWVKYNITNRDLEGNICLTRNEEQATLQGTFSYYTHYEALRREVLSTSSEAIDLLLFGDDVEVNGEQIKFYEGSKFVVISPSFFAGSSYNGTGGYAGQYTLDSDKPVMSEIEILEIISDIELYELNQVNTFVLSNGNYTWESPYIENDDGEDELATGLYINYGYTPSSMLYDEEYSYGDSRNITDLAELNDSVATLLIDRFGLGDDSGDVITSEESSNIWYIARMLNGFIIDTNIEEVRALVFNDTENSTAAITYTADDDLGSYVDMWYYTIPLLQYGKWASVVGISDYGYGTSTREDDGTSTEILSNTPLLFEIYIEEYSY